MFAGPAAPPGPASRGSTCSLKDFLGGGKEFKATGALHPSNPASNKAGLVLREVTQPPLHKGLEVSRQRPASTLILEVLLGVANVSAGSMAGFADPGRGEPDGVDLLLGATTSPIQLGQLERRCGLVCEQAAVAVFLRALARMGVSCGTALRPLLAAWRIDLVALSEADVNFD